MRPGVVVCHCILYWWVRIGRGWVYQKSGTPCWDFVGSTPGRAQHGDFAGVLDLIRASLLV